MMAVTGSVRYKPLCQVEECPFVNGPVTSGETSECVANERLWQRLEDVFNLRNFRPGQLEALLPALHGKDTFVRMATGAGKSLCMFLVPIASGDTSMGIIISPLNSLMNEQV